MCGNRGVSFFTLGENCSDSSQIVIFNSAESQSGSNADLVSEWLKKGQEIDQSLLSKMTHLLANKHLKVKV